MNNWNKINCLSREKFFPYSKYSLPILSSSSSSSSSQYRSQSSSKLLHRDAAPAASLTKISDVNVKTVMGAQRLLSAVDGALRRVDAERGDLGATMNRMEHTIDNLSNIVVNTKISRSRMQDADMAAESIELTKGRILQQAATSMLSQANQSMQSVLELLQ